MGILNSDRWRSVPFGTTLEECMLTAKTPTDNPWRGCVYFIEIDGLIKIGRSANFKRRRTQYPPHAKVLYVHPTLDSFTLEAELRRRFHRHLRRGNEWFNADEEIYDYIDYLREQEARAS